MAHNEIDSLLADLGIDNNSTSSRKSEINLKAPPPIDPKHGIAESEVDSLLAAVGVNPSAKINPPAKKVSSGPGALAKKSSGPGPVLAPVGRGTPLATHTPDGRPITHSGPPCAACNEMIIGKVVNAMDKTWHPEHFVCKQCSKPFPGGNFIEYQSSPYCEDCYNDQFCPKCHVCKGPIADKCVSVLNGTRKYHPNHFACNGCGKSLVGQPYKEDEGEIYCNVCRDARIRRKPPNPDLCGKCKQPILGEYITLAGQKMHAEHYRCQDCGCEFKGGNCHEYEGKLYCYECYLKLLRQSCASCNKPILGRSITALGRVWHPEHFVCYVCHEPFSGHNFFDHEVNGVLMPFCETHFAQRYGEVCNRCSQPVIRNAVHFFDKVYHEEHFTCSGCDKPLKSGSIQEWESKPLCMQCYGNLPKEVRKKIDKKREAEKKLDKQRAAMHGKQSNN